MKIIRNAIRCKKCGEVIESKSVHDFKFCSAAHLKENRRSALDALKRDMLKKFPGKQATKAYLEKRLTYFRDAPVKTEFAGVLIWYLNRQLMRS